MSAGLAHSRGVSIFVLLSASEAPTFLGLWPLPPASKRAMVGGTLLRSSHSAFSLPLSRTFGMAFRVHLAIPGSSPHLRIVTLITSAESSKSQISCHIQKLDGTPLGTVITRKVRLQSGLLSYSRVVLRRNSSKCFMLREKRRLNFIKRKSIFPTGKLCPCILRENGLSRTKSLMIRVSSRCGFNAHPGLD